MQTFSAVKLAHLMLREKLRTCRGAVDATAGNGADTLFFCRTAPAEAKIWAFDIQQDALAATRARLAGENLAGRAVLVADSHARLERYVDIPLQAVIFNLGYRPGGAHAVTTQAASTVSALKQTAELLAVGGAAAVVAYPGHAAGAAEHAAVRAFLAGLPEGRFTAGCWSMVNHGDGAPVLYVIEKVRS